jgi:hypothetical protein
LKQYYLEVIRVLECRIEGSRNKNDAQWRDTSVIKYRDDIFNVYLSGQRVLIFLLGIDKKRLPRGQPLILYSKTIFLVFIPEILSFVHHHLLLEAAE